MGPVATALAALAVFMVAMGLIVFACYTWHRRTGRPFHVSSCWPSSGEGDGDEDTEEGGVGYPQPRGGTETLRFSSHPDPVLQMIRGARGCDIR